MNIYPQEVFIIQEGIPLRAVHLLGLAVLLLISAGLVVQIRPFHRAPSPPKDTLIITAPAPQIELLPLYLSIAAGYCAAEGLEIQIRYESDPVLAPKRPVLAARRMEEVLYTRLEGGPKETVVAVLKGGNDDEPEKVVLG